MSLLIGKHIIAILSSDPAVRNQVGARIYPVAIPESTPKFPLVVYINNGTNPDYSKDGTLEDTVTVTIVLLHKDYNGGITLINHMRYLFEDVKAKYADFEVTGCQLSSSAEDYDPELAKYVFSINLTFTTIDYEC